MTRGKIYLFSKRKHVLITTEFNGDMYLSGHGKEIIRAFKTGKLYEEDGFRSFVKTFDRNHFAYEMNGDPILWESFSAGDSMDVIFDFTTNFTDYIYLVNGSDQAVDILVSDTGMGIGNKSRMKVPAGDLAIIRFHKFEKLVKGSDPESLGYLHKEDFMDIIKELEMDQIKSWEDTLLKLLMVMFRDKRGKIRKFIYDNNFGKECYEGRLTFNTADALYESLVCDMALSDREEEED